MSSLRDERAKRQGMLSREEIQSTRERHPIEQLVAAYAELRPVGRRLVARCPLPGHVDSSPSFSVYPDESRFYCYGCNRGGDVLTFLQLVEGIGFREAVEMLEPDPRRITVHMTTHGIPNAVPSERTIPSVVPTPPKTRESQPRSLDDASLRLLTAAAEVYHTSLLLNPEMLAYVTGRGITIETIKRFHLGYATGENLNKYFRFRGWDVEMAKELGLVGAHGEFFRQRIILPEWRKGRVVYLTGRKTQEYQQVKYLGLRGAEKPLYGLEMVHGSEEVYVVEGAFDLLTLVQWGYPAVALFGTHLKEECKEELAFAKRVIIVTDSDEPGRSAACQLAQVFRERSIIVPPLPKAKDVNELAMQPDGREAFRDLLARTTTER